MALNRKQERPFCIYSKLHRNQANNRAISPCPTHTSHLPLPLPTSTERWSGPSGVASDLKRHRGRSNTWHSELSCPIHNDPSANDGQYQIDENHTLSFRTFMHTSNLNFQVHITISKVTYSAARQFTYNLAFFFSFFFFPPKISSLKWMFLGYE